MELRRTFLISLLISLFLNLAVFGFLIHFKPLKPKKNSIINIFLEESPSQRLLETEKSRKKVGSYKNSDIRNKVCKEKRPVFRKKAVKSARNVGLHRQIKYKTKPDRENRKVVSQKTVRKTKSLKQQKVLKTKEENRNRPLVRENFLNKTESSKLKGFYKAEEALKREGRSFLSLHRGKTAVEKTESEVLRSLASGGVAGAPQKTKESRERKAAQKEREDYLKLVLQEIEKNKFYPLIARRMGIEGRVKLKIVIGKGGELLSVSVLSSDSSVLEKAAVKTLKKCHFPPPPGGKFETELTIRYKLR